MGREVITDRREREQMKNEGCQMGGREVTGRQLLLSGGTQWLRSYKVTNLHPNLPQNFMTHRFLDPTAFNDNSM